MKKTKLLSIVTTMAMSVCMVFGTFSTASACSNCNPPSDEVHGMGDLPIYYTLDKLFEMSDEDFLAIDEAQSIYNNIKDVLETDPEHNDTLTGEFKRRITFPDAEYTANVTEKEIAEVLGEATDFYITSPAEEGLSDNFLTVYFKDYIGASPTEENIINFAKCGYCVNQIISLEYISRANVFDPSPGYNKEILSNTLENLVAKDTSFANHSFIYSDKYKFAMESGEDRDILIIYEVPEEDSYNWKFKEYIEANLEEYSCLADVGFYPAGENRDIYSGYRFSVCSSSSEFTLERPLDVMFFVNNEVPYYAENVEEASEQTGFDISPYIYSDDVISTEYTVPEGAEPTKYGDVTGDSDISISDVVKLNSFMINSESYPMTYTQIANADCLKDNVINSKDSTLLLNYVAMIIDESELGK